MANGFNDCVDESIGRPDPCTSTTRFQPVNDEVVATVTEWHAADGWGRVMAATSGDDVWTHFSTIEGRALGALHVGEQVRLWYQEGPRPAEFQATRVVPISDYEPGTPEPRPPGEAYGSSLTITHDPD